MSNIQINNDNIMIKLSDLYLLTKALEKDNDDYKNIMKEYTKFCISHDDCSMCIYNKSDNCKFDYILNNDCDVKINIKKEG